MAWRHSAPSRNRPSRPGGTTKTQDLGLWAVTGAGTVRKLIAEGDTLDTKTVKTFTVLKAARGSGGIRRSFAAHGTTIVRVYFTDGALALYEITPSPRSLIPAAPPPGATPGRSPMHTLFQRSFTRINC
jgi:hypothetical protein